MTLAAVLGYGSPVLAASNVTVVAATGGTAIPAATNAATGTGTYTPLTGPVLTENNPGAISSIGTVVLNAPAGFAFNTTANSVTATVKPTPTKSCSGTNAMLLNGAASQTVTPTASAITITISQISSGSHQCVITFSGIGVRPTVASPLANGTITKSGTAAFTAIGSAPNYGTLTEVVGPPTVTTTAATSVAATTATLNGTVSSNGAITTVTFDYGTTIAYGSSATATQSPLAAGAIGTAVSAAVSGLTCNTLYHFRVKGVNSAGTTNGSDATFTTTACVPTATTNAATSVAATTATFNGTVSSNGASTAVTFEYGLTAGYGSTGTATPSPVAAVSGSPNSTAVSLAVAGLTCNTLYHFRVKGVNSIGTTNGSDATFTTTACVPTATTNAATSVAATTATFNGTVSSNGASTTVTFDYGTTIAYGSSATATQSPLAAGAIGTAVSAAVSGLTCNTLYHFRVKGVNSAGTTNGSDATFTTSVCSAVTVVSAITRNDPTPTSLPNVSWTVTFSASASGVDASPFALVASGLSGAFITTVTGSGTTWTVTANTGIGSGTLGLNQSGAGSVVPTLNGTFTGQVYTITATPALAEYRMDEASWNGTAGEVVDSSGSGNSAQAVNSASTDAATPAIAGSPGTCRYGVFDNGTSITQGYVLTPLPDLTTNFTVTAWIRTTNTATVGQQILVDDQSASTGYGFSFNGAGAGVLRFYSRAITPVNLDSTYTIAANTWYFVAAVADITNKIRTIYVFNAAGTLLNSTTETAWAAGAWGTDAGPVMIGGTAALHFKGNLDEVRVYQKVLSQNALTALATQTHACPVYVPDHLVIQSSGSGLTCAASTLTVVACQNAACTIPFMPGVSGTLTATGAGMTVNWDATTGGAAGAGFSIPNGSSSVTKNVQVATAGTVVFGITSPVPLPTNATTCNFGSPACTFTANTAGFTFTNSTTGSSYTIPAQVSGIATPALYLRALQASTNNPAACTPAIIGQTTPVNMGYVCNNPATCQAGNLATINTTAIAPGGTSVSLTFDGNGSAPLTARYDDVGQITLNTSKTVTPFSGATAITLNGSSNAYVVAPHHFGISGVTAGPIKASNNFSATITAYNGLATPTVTPNFGKETAPGPEGVALTSTLVTPNPVTYPAASNPTVGNSAIPGSEFGAGGMVSDPNGVATANNLSWGEVGNITLTAALTSGSYLASGLTASGTSTTVGAFIPDHFDTAVIASAGVPMPCPTTCLTPFNGFIYSGQPFSVQVTARNLANGTTTNYRDAYGLSNNVNLSAWDALGSVTTQNPPGTGVLANATVSATAFGPGVATTSAPTYTLPTVTTAPTDIYLRAVDAVNTTVTSRRATPASSIEGGVKVVSGRIRIPNGYGSERLPLPMTATVQYFNGTNWLTSLTDSVTAFNSGLTPSGNLVASDVPGSPTCGMAVTSPGTSPVIAGVRTFTLSAPGVRCSANMSFNAPIFLPSSPARATFGVYKSPLIYRRENY